MYQTKSNRESLQTLIKKADDVFNKYVRKRDAHRIFTGCLNCFVCGAALRLSDAQCLHYIDRHIKSKSLQKFMRHELEELIQTYKDKLKALN